MTFSDIPPELESEILSRVPATSLVQLQTTCKRWYFLFKESEFVEKNLVKGKAETKVMLKQCDSDFSVSINMHNGFDPYIEFTRKLKGRPSVKVPSSFEIFEICHYNGLLLCTTNPSSSRLVVWNPCTSEIRWIKNIQTPTSNFHKYFLGYNKSCHSYKILSFNNPFNVRVPGTGTQFNIYEFNTESWRVLNGITHDWGTKSNGVTLKGNAYCFARKMEEPLLTFMLKFDFTTEKFERLSLPSDQSEFDDECVFLSVIKEEKLALLYLDHTDSSVMKIWVTNSKSDEAKDLSWSSFLVVDLEKFETFDYIEDEISFLVDEENKMVVYAEEDYSDKDRTKIHVVGEDIHEEVYRGTGKGEMYNHPLLVSYVPSLVQILARQTHSGGKRKR